MKITTDQLPSNWQKHIDISTAIEAKKILDGRQGLGGEFTGWMDLVDLEDTKEIEHIAKKVRKESDALVVVGIGGSYLGAKAAVDFLEPDFPIYFLGHTIAPKEINRVLKELEGKKFFVNYISKSGGTLEPALSFRLLRKQLTKRYGDNWKQYVIATTDKSSGKLRDLAKKEHMDSFVVPDDVGGRYSVLSPVGLFPLATAGIDIQRMLAGGRSMKRQCAEEKAENNPALKYASLRQWQYNQGKQIELLATFDPSLRSLGEWWKQLFGESEGKKGLGIFPASATFTTDLHSLGQWIQEGQRILFETILWIDRDTSEIKVPNFDEDYDGLKELEGKSFHWINGMAAQGTQTAHAKGNVPTIQINLGKRDPFDLGELFFFFEYACGVSAYMQEVNPFDQPGVEAYKKNMKTLLFR